MRFDATDVATAEEIAKRWEATDPVLAAQVKEQIEKIAEDHALPPGYRLAKQAQDERDAYKKALEWYADEKNYQAHRSAYGPYIPAPAEEDRGQKARRALGIT